MFDSTLFERDFDRFEGGVFDLFELPLLDRLLLDLLETTLFDLDLDLDFERDLSEAADLFELALPDLDRRDTGLLDADLDLCELELLEPDLDLCDPDFSDLGLPERDLCEASLPERDLGRSEFLEPLLERELDLLRLRDLFDAGLALLGLFPFVLLNSGEFECDLLRPGVGAGPVGLTLRFDSLSDTELDDIFFTT